MKIVIFGTSLFYKTNKNNKDLLENEIVAFLDNDQSKVGKILDGKMIYAPSELDKILFDRIFIMSSYVGQIKKQLFELGVSDEKIYEYPYGGFEYDAWFRLHKATNEQLTEQRQYKFSYEPCISIVVPTYNTPKGFLKEMIDAVREQTYSKWELCIADASNRGHVREILQEYEKNDSRIKIRYLEDNKGISENTNKAVEMSSGDYIAFYDHDDLLTPDALYEIVKRINEDRSIDFIYTDEDKIEENGKYVFSPFFKPDYSPDLLLHSAYILHLMVVSRKLLDEMGYLKKEYDGAQDHELSLRLTKEAKNIIHIPKILYHWRAHSGSVAADMGCKLYAYEAGQKAVDDFVMKQHPKGSTSERINGSFQVQYELSERPIVSVIVENDILTEEKLKLCKNLKSRLNYAEHEFIIATSKNAVDDNMEKEEVHVEEKVHVFEYENENKVSKIKSAVEKSKGKYLIFLDDAMMSLNEDFIGQLLMQCQRKEIGIVGGKVVNEHKVMSAGLIVQSDCRNGYMPIGEDTIYFGKNFIPRNVSAVSGNGMMIERELYEAVGELSEEFCDTYCDVDLCLKVRQKGLMILYTPMAVIQTGSVQPFLNKKDQESFIQKWYHEKKIDEWDPYYNRNLDGSHFGMLKM